jgi:hypothetical protein
MLNESTRFQQKISFRSLATERREGCSLLETGVQLLRLIV